MRPWKSFRGVIHAILLLALALACAPVLSEQQTIELSGRLSYPDGRPAGGVTMGFGRTQVVTGPDGYYQVEVKPGHVWVKVTHGDFVLGENLNISDGDSAAQVRDFALSYACLVLGEVTDAATSQPLEGARAAVYGRFGAQTTTGPAGAFTIRVPPVPDLTLHVERNGYVTTRLNFSAEGLETMGFKARLKPGGVIRGKVVDDAGAPMQGAEVSITEDQVYGKSARTGEDGSYELRDVDTERPVQVRVSLDSYSSQDYGTAQFAEGSMETTVDFVVKRVALRSASGRVVDASGAPVAGAEVAYGTSTHAGNKKTTKTDADGEFKLQDLRPDRSMILVQAKGFAPAMLALEENGDQRFDVTIEEPHFAEIRVVDAAGKPIAGASVTVDAKTPVLGRLYSSMVIGADIYRSIGSTVTDHNGAARLTDLPPEGTVVSIWKKGYAAPWDMRIRTDSTDNVIVMRGRPQIAGKVVDSETGNPIRGFAAKWGSSYDSNAVFNLPDGSFRVELDDDRFLDKSEYSVKVSAKGYVAEEKTIRTVDAPRVDYSNVFKLRKSFPINGKVTDASGKGVAGAKITVVENDGIQRYMIPPQISDSAYQLKTTTDALGRFTISSALERVAAVILEKEGFSRLVREKVDLTKPVDIVLPAPAVLEVVAASFAGDGAYVYLSIERDRCTTTVSSGALPADGRMVHSELEPGAYRVQVSRSGQMAMRMIRLKSGERYVLDLDRERPVRVSGVVTRRGEPVAGVRASVSRGENRDYSITGPDGRFTIAFDETGLAAINFYEDGPGGTSNVAFGPLDLKPGENTVDQALPAGVVTGRVVDAPTGAPIGGEIVEAQIRWPASSHRHYSSPYAGNSWGRVVSSIKTASDGSFTLDGVPSEEVVIAVRGKESYVPSCVTRPMLVDEKTPLENVTIGVDEPGILDLSVVDAKTGKPVTGQITRLMTEDGVPVHSRSSFQSPSEAPPGSYTLWVKPLDGRHLPAWAKLEIKPGKTAKAQVKVPAAEQRIVFQVPRGSRFEKLRWTTNAAWSSGAPGDDEQHAWIGYSLSDAATGEPVVIGPFGPEWGGFIERSDANPDLAIAVKPGTYLLEAVLRNTEDFAIDSDANLWRTKQKVTVKAGKDSVIVVK